MKRFAFLIVFLAVILGCTREGDGVEIRVGNACGVDLQNIIVNTSSGNVQYGELKAGEVSAYKVFDIAYRYAFIQVNMGDEVYTFQPIDYVGEEPLTEGRYTYELTIIDRNLFIKLKTD